MHNIQINLYLFHNRSSSLFPLPLNYLYHLKAPKLHCKITLKFGSRDHASDVNECKRSGGLDDDFGVFAMDALELPEEDINFFVLLFQRKKRCIRLE